ncbi:hypothetical protein PTKIN_Ptkin05aG0082500 [Pterospermum kingtungense]
MMSESNKAINVFSTSMSSSRLSPSARPFTISNPLNRHESFEPLLDSSSSSSSTSRFGQPFPYMSLGSQGHHGYYAYHSDAISITAFPCVDDLQFEPNSSFAYHPLEESPVDTHFTLLTHQSSQTSSSSCLGNVDRNEAKGSVLVQQGREFPHNKGQIRSAGSLSCYKLIEQGTSVGGSKLVSETSSVLHGKGGVVSGKDNQMKLEDKKNIITESSIFGMANTEVNLMNKSTTKPFSIPLDFLLSPGTQDTQSQLSYSAPLITWSGSDSTIITNERCFRHIGSYGAETLVSCAPECFSCSAQIFKPSSASSNPPIVNPVPLENVASGDTVAFSNWDSSSGYVVLTRINADKMQNPVDKVSCCDQVITEKGEKRKIEPVQNGTKNLSIVAKSKLQIACPKVHEDLTLEQDGARAGIPDDKASTNNDDSDVDSPCWKGVQAYTSPFRVSVPVNSEDSKGQSPSRVSVPLKSEHCKNEKVAHYSLNPLAPVFVPGNSKRKMDYHQTECHGDTLRNIAALDGTSSSREHKLLYSVKADTCPSEKINDIGIKCSEDARVANSRGFQSYLREGHASSENQLVQSMGVVGSMKGSVDAVHNKLDSVEDLAHSGPNTSIFLTSEVGLNSHPIRVGVFSDFSQRLQEPSKSKAPQIDVKLRINTIQYLLELLLQNSSFDLGSLTGHEHDKLLNIINNLYVIRNKVGQMTVRPESSDPFTLYGQIQPADRHEVTMMKDKAVLHEEEMHKTAAPMFSSRIPYTLYQSNLDEALRKGNDPNQVLEKDPKLIHLVEHEMPPEALFYRKLWLEAKAALYLMKHQVHSMHMKSELDRF